MSSQLHQQEYQRKREDLGVGLDFLLTHFREPAFPRKISTALTEGGQFEVWTKAEVLEAAQKAGYLDCRINAYRPYTGYKGINRQAPDLLFIDIDRGTFASDQEHRQACRQLFKTSRVSWADIQPLSGPEMDGI